MRQVLSDARRRGCKTARCNRRSPAFPCISVWAIAMCVQSKRGNKGLTERLGRPSADIDCAVGQLTRDLLRDLGRYRSGDDRCGQGIVREPAGDIEPGTVSGPDDASILKLLSSDMTRVLARRNRPTQFWGASS